MTSDRSEHPERMPSEAPRSHGATIRTYRTLPSVVIGWAMIAGAAIFVGSFLISAGGNVIEVLTPLAVVSVLAAATWVGMLRPAVVLREDGVLLRNLVTDVDVPFSHLEEVGDQWSLELVDGAGIKHSSWAIPVRRPMRPPTTVNRDADGAAPGTKREGNHAMSVAGQVDTAWTRWRDAGGRRVSAGLGVQRAVAPGAVGPLALAGILVLAAIIF